MTCATPPKAPCCPTHRRRMAPRSLAVILDHEWNTAWAAAMAARVSSPFIFGKVAMGLPVAGLMTWNYVQGGIG